MILSNAHAQATRSDPTDVQGWFSTALGFDLPKKWSAEMEYQARLFNNLNTFNGSYYSFGLEKKINKYIAVTAEYRLAKVLKGTYHRYSGGFVLDKKWKKTRTDLRVLYQNQIQDFDDPASERQFNHYIRARFRIRQPINKKTSLLFAVEPIYKLSPGITIDNYRIQTGLRYAILPMLDAEVYYINRPDYAKSYKRKYHVVGAGVKYEIKVNKKKSKM